MVQLVIRARLGLNTHESIKNHNNIVGEERLAHIRTIVVSLGGKLTYVFLYGTTELLRRMYIMIFGVSTIFRCWWPYFIVCGFNRTIKAVNVFFYCLWGFWCFCLACRTWSWHESAGPLGAWVGTQVLNPLRAYVKVADCYDPSSLGTLTCVKMIKTYVESTCATVRVRFTIADYFFCFGEDG
jgi:hypothetical protein